ncbi:MAG TPA: glycosyltransferase family 9 protein [Candidatus Limnocylindrales bacterium]|nr:glycosyltransferase family 9 protein [Candidatus Limnocylindrales bacterium]
MLPDPDANPTRGHPPGSPLAGSRRVLVVRLDNLGDVLLTGPTFRALRAAVPDAELVLLGSPGGSAAASLLPWVDRVETLRAVWQDAQSRLPLDPARELAVIDDLRAIGADAAVILTSFSQTSWAPAYACYLAGIPVRAGHAPDFGGSLLSHPVAGPAPAHQAERNLHVLTALGVPVTDDSLEIRVPASATDAASRLLARGGLDGRVPPIVVLPGASCAARRYPADRFAAVARGVRDRTGLPLVIAGAEKERPLTATVAAAVPGALDLGGETGVTELAAIVERAALVLTNDSFGMHLADAVRVPVVTVFAGTDLEAEWAPRSAPSITLRRPTSCAPCRLFDCPIGHPCVDIPPEEVATAAIGLLETAPARRELSWAG